jgi:hypothetical protein
VSEGTEQVEQRIRDNRRMSIDAYETSTSNGQKMLKNDLSKKSKAIPLHAMVALGGEEV